MDSKTAGMSQPSGGIARISLADELTAVVAALHPLVKRRDQVIVEQLWGLRSTSPKTLEEVGAALNLTRERVRQLRNRAVPRIAAAFRTAPTAFVRLARAEMARSGNVWDRADAAGCLASHVATGDYDPTSYLLMLVVWEAIEGMSLFEGFLVVAQPVSPDAVSVSRSELKGALERGPALLLSDLTDVVGEACPLLAEVSCEALARHLAEREGRRVLPGMYARAPWHRAEYAEFVLEHVGQPMHFTVIAERMASLIGEDVPTPGLNSLLNSDRRFVRVGAGDFALAKWGARRYGRFDEVIQRYLAAGRIAEHFSRIQHELLINYTVAPSTVLAMMNMNRSTFHHFGGGYWGLCGYTPMCDDPLVRLVEGVIRKAPRAVTASTITVELVTSAPGAPVTEEEVARVLYLHPTLKREGKGATTRFRF